MDMDVYAATRRSEWDRLQALGKQRHLSGAESDELIARYQSGATDLSAMRTTFGDTTDATALAMLLSKARMRFTRARRNPLVTVRELFVEQLPAALYAVRWWTLAAALFTVLVAIGSYTWHIMNPELMQFYGSQAQLENYAKEDFINYYSEFSETAFAAKVFTNNAWIAAVSIALGFTGLFPIMMLMQNAFALGMSAAVLGTFGHLDAFFLWIAPHGLLELTMIFVAAGAGFAVFWSLIAPGPQPRLYSVAKSGRILFLVAIGTTIFLFISGLIEGFVTRQDWPWAIKIGIGALALAGYCIYAYALGRRATRAGHDGDLDAADAGHTKVYAD